MKRVEKSQGRDPVMRTLPLYILLSLKHLSRKPYVMKSRPLGPTVIKSTPMFRVFIIPQHNGPKPNSPSRHLGPRRPSPKLDPLERR